MINSNALIFLLGFQLVLSCGTACAEGIIVSEDNFIESHADYGYIVLPSSIVGGSGTDQTGIRVTKSLSPSSAENSLEFQIALEMPPKPAQLDIVLAMDTSGSMVQHFQGEDIDGKRYIDWAGGILSSIIAHYPEARVSVVSWDDDYEMGDTKSDFIDVETNRTKIEGILNNLSNESLETDHTIYSIGVKRAVEALDDNPPVDPYNTARIIIFLTGLSEFAAEPRNASGESTLAKQLANAAKSRSYNTTSNFNGYQIYTVRIGINSSLFKWQYQNLSMISRATQISGQPKRDPIPLENIEDLSTAIDSILEKLKSRPVAYDVEVTDTLYPYLRYLGSSNNEGTPVNVKINPSDNTTTLRWYIGTMNGSETWTSRISARLLLNLPIEVSTNRTELEYVIANNTPISEVRYQWMTGYNGSIGLPEGKIDLSSGRSI
ncbi:MAG: VWA domain-containing protein [Methanotrichaceae archaeon]|nr:VWA domain-containing protein [Methanotrichaceae archaeon]